MKTCLSIITALLVLGNNPVTAHFIGEPLKSWTGGGKVEELRSGVYKVASPGQRLSFVSVNRDGIIYEIKILGFTNVYSLVSLASMMCDGDVSMPTAANNGFFTLKNSPGAKHAGKRFDIQMSNMGDDNNFELTVTCNEYAVSKGKQ